MLNIKIIKNLNRCQDNTFLKLQKHHYQEHFVLLCMFQIFRFCRSKCHKAFKKKRNPRKTRWTKAYRKAAGKDLTVDPVFEFEKRRNEPVKHSQELMQKTSRLRKIVCSFDHFCVWCVLCIRLVVIVDNEICCLRAFLTLSVWLKFTLILIVIMA